MTTDGSNGAEGIEVDEGAPDSVCGTCGHDGRSHRLREIELAGTTARDTYCEECAAACEFVPRPEP